MLSTDPSPLWNQLTAHGGLVEGWTRVLTNNGAAGGDRVTVTAFGIDVEHRLASLAAALRSGRYRPGPCRRVEIPKKRGDTRPLDIPCVADRVVQSATALLLTPVIDRHLEPESFAYRPGRGVAHAVAAVAATRRDGYRWTAEGDIERCFESIPHEPVLRRLEAICGDTRITDLTHLWLEAFAPSGVGLPQGSPISPLLCNLHLDAVDEAVRGRGVRLVRYADDFLLMTKTGAGAEAALERMSSLLAGHGVRLNPDKTRVRDYDRSIRFLGHVFTRGMAWKEVINDEGDGALPLTPREDELSEAPGGGSRTGPDETVRPGRLARRQRVIYMVESGRRLEIEGEAFTVRDEDARGWLQEHATRVDRIEIGPGASASWSALALAAAHDVTVVRVDHWGQTLGLWSTGAEPRARRMMAQATALADPERKLALARTLAAGRIENQRRLLKHYNLKRREAELAETCVQLDRSRRMAASAESVAVARGHEGNAGRLYWPTYGRLFDAALGHPDVRSRRPPRDAVNATISYLSALLERDLRVAVERAGLHPGMGALHEPSETETPSLVFDLMEAFRAPLVEALAVWLTSRRALTPAMFVAHASEDGEAFVRLEPGARKAIIRGYEYWVARPIQSRRTRQKILWRALLEEEAQALATHFEDGEPFIPYRMDY